MTDLIDLAHELALIENVTRVDLAMSQASPPRNDFMTGYDKHMYYVAEVLGLVTYDSYEGVYY